MGGFLDEIIQRAIDLLISIPHIPLWMALAAALPRDWTTVKTYFAITIVLSIVGWAGLARVVRSKLLALREEDFTVAAIVAGASQWRIVSRHLLPLFLSYIVVSITLAIPGMILGETALSFIGLGLQPPAVQLGGPAAGCPADRSRGPPSLAAVYLSVRDPDGADVQFSGRWAARCR